MRTGVRVAIVGDDLTGVSTAAATVAAALSIGAEVSWAGPMLDAAIRSASGVLGISTTSRTLESSLAHDVVSTAVRSLRANGAPTIIKRFDSWLRGPIGAELVAFREAGEFSTVFVVGAYPSLGRTTVAGVQRSGDRPVHETTVGGSSERAVFGTSHIPTILEEAGAKNVVCIDASWHHWPAQQRHAYLGGLMQSAQFLVFDAASEEDLVRVRYEVECWPTAGVACTDVRWRFESQSASPKTGAASRPRVDREGHVVAAVGSITGTSREQLRHMRTRSYYLQVDETNDVEVIGGAPADAIWVVASPDPSSTSAAAPDRIWCSGVGATVAEIVSRVPVRGLVLIGGETAQAVCDQLGVSAIRSLRLIGPGTCIGEVQIAANESVPVITRSGAVGDVADLERLCGMV